MRSKLIMPNLSVAHTARPFGDTACLWRPREQSGTRHSISHERSDETVTHGASCGGHRSYSFSIELPGEPENAGEAGYSGDCDGEMSPDKNMFWHLCVESSLQSFLNQRRFPSIMASCE